MKTLSDIVNDVHANGAASGATKAQVEAIVKGAFATIAQALSNGEEVKVHNFGVLSVSERSARQGRNPLTGESIQIAASKGVKFKVSKTLKESL